MNRSNSSEDFGKVDEAIAGLSTEIQPGRDLWPGIAAGMSASGQPAPLTLHWWQSPILVAASLMIAASALTYALTRPEAQVQPGAASQERPAYAFDAGFLANRKRLSKELEGRISELSPEMQALVRQNLVSIQGSMNQISMALGEDPSNANLQDLLLGTYEQELQVMTELARMPETRTRRIDL